MTIRVNFSPIDSTLNLAAKAGEGDRRKLREQIRSNLVNEALNQRNIDLRGFQAQSQAALGQQQVSNQALQNVARNRLQEMTLAFEQDRERARQALQQQQLEGQQASQQTQAGFQDRSLTLREQQEGRRVEQGQQRIKLAEQAEQRRGVPPQADPSLQRKPASLNELFKARTFTLKDRQDLESRFERGLLTEEQFDAQLEDLRISDSNLKSLINNAISGQQGPAEERGEPGTRVNPLPIPSNPAQARKGLIYQAAGKMWVWDGKEFQEVN